MNYGHTGYACIKAIVSDIEELNVTSTDFVLLTENAASHEMSFPSISVPEKDKDIIPTILIATF